MPIDRSRALGHTFPSGTFTWTDREVILYHLGVGAGTPATSQRELAYCYEEGLKVLPTFSTLMPFEVMADMSSVPGLDVDPAMMLHGEQETLLHQPIPVAGTARVEACITELWDKGRAAVLVMEAVASLDGEPLATQRVSAFIRGEGGFDGPSGPSATRTSPPDHAPDHEWVRTTREDLALLYRLSGDRNPIHADPALAARVGFDRPILHGLCTYGIVCKAVVDEVLDGDVQAVAAFRARFAGIVLPGEPLRIRAWEDGALVHLVVTAPDRDDAPVLSDAALTGR